ncbi:single-stranded DNA-binding protein [Candidatus Dojkabacteria bacterium]|uniref:Single-stranded DNA-binding protein n=1 Tax=Candidatus Dojkabacteria bacterium TaxID=2099670 RepID=A0A955HZ79_9BACT|nr:single-stranded DNA-binding protein [Candidatus Dojkabacteria bacterium]MCB9790623.1 single-stranded DNA-binding protein [Candidatus Nomurabacteria bacterium]
MATRSLNKVMLIGNVTRDPEMRYTASGTPVATFGLATNRYWKDKNGEKQESTQFHNLVAWDKMGEISNQIVTKGAKIYVEGELVTRSWEGDDGVTRYKTEIRINEMILLSSKNDFSSSSQSTDDDVFDDNDKQKKKSEKKDADPEDEAMPEDPDESEPDDIDDSEDPTDDELPF